MNKVTLILGTFDGVHLGHKALLEKAKQIKRQYGAQPVAVSFRQHPAAVLGKKVDLLTTNDEKRELIYQTGQTGLELLDFTESFSRLSPEEYIAFLYERFHPSFMITGNNHTFGRNASGTPKDIVALSQKYNYKVFVVPPVLLDGQVVSSTLIRESIKAGNIDYANKLLGYSYFLTGGVIKGEAVGRDLGFPTANITPNPEKLLPSCGVYAAIAQTGGQTYSAVTNIGVRPTVSDGHKTTVETYLLGFEDELYGKTLTIRFLKKVRDEIKFSTKSELSRQQQQDVLVSQAYINNLYYKNKHIIGGEI